MSDQVRAVRKWALARGKKYEYRNGLSLLTRIEEELLSLDANGVIVDHEIFVVIDLLRERMENAETPV